MIIGRAPYRISFFGGGTDYPEWYKEHGGAVLSTSINKYCYIMARHLPPYFEHNSRIVWSEIELVKGWQEIRHPQVREALKWLNMERVEIHHQGDLPHQTGIGTSSSFAVALLNALYTLKDYKAEKSELARDAIHLERDLSCNIVGDQDQTAAAFGGFNRIDFDIRGTRLTPVDGSKLEPYLMLFFTGFQRRGSMIEMEKVATMPLHKADFTILQKMVDTGEHILKNNDMCDFGLLLHEAWQVKRSLNNKVSTDYINFLYDKARNAGAKGGKILGAGGGGFLLLFVEPDKQKAVKEAMGELLQVDFKFENEGSRIIYKE